MCAGRGIWSRGESMCTQRGNLRGRGFVLGGVIFLGGGGDLGRERIRAWKGGAKICPGRGADMYWKEGDSMLRE